MGHVIADGLRWTVAGALFGLAGSAALLRFLRGLLYEVSTNDWRISAMSTLVLFAIAMLATYLPGRRAVRIDPMVALRHE